MAEIFIAIGVSGSGKTTIGKLLSKEKNIPFFDADDFHSEKNKTKMRSGIPLNDEDRVDWLTALNELAIQHDHLQGAVIACSALKEKYRSLLIKNVLSPVYWVVLKGGYEILHQRMEERKDHYMPPGLLNSQLNTMEYPPYGIHIHVDQRPEVILKQILDNQLLNEFGLVGLGVMGKSLARNLGSKGIKLSLYNQHRQGIEEKIAHKAIESFDELRQAKGFDDISSYVQSLQKPRKIFLMVPAGPPVDEVIAQLKPFLNEGDIIMDGGNSHFRDTERRQLELNKDQIHFIGIGVSGGEQGALKGPAIMPGGPVLAYSSVEPILNAIAARDKNNHACSGYIGSGGSGHFVKMIHNGIEYAEMQIISEVYWILKRGLHKTNEDIAQLFDEWNQGSLSSYLLEITIKVLRHKSNGSATLDQIVDIGGSKGTGSWSLSSAAELGIPATLMSDALFARYISSLKTERIQFGNITPPSNHHMTLELDKLSIAFSLARWINHHQGFEILQSASKQYGWNLNLAETARIWTSGCIIRSVMMETIAQKIKEQQNILMSIVSSIKEHQVALIEVVTKSLQATLAIPCFSSALNYLLAYTSADSPVNLIQAQRDFFGAHTYKKIDDPFGKSYHTDWES